MNAQPLLVHEIIRQSTSSFFELIDFVRFALKLIAIASFGTENSSRYFHPWNPAAQFNRQEKGE